MEKRPSLADQFASETPQADRLAEVSEEMDTIRQFVDWLAEQGIHLGQVSPSSGRLYSTSATVEVLLYQYYGVDSVKLEQERRMLLTQARALSEGRGADQR